MEFVNEVTLADIELMMQEIVTSSACNDEEHCLCLASDGQLNDIRKEPFEWFFSNIIFKRRRWLFGIRNVKKTGWRRR